MPVRGGIASKSYITVDNGALVTDGYVKAEGACTGRDRQQPGEGLQPAGQRPDAGDAAVALDLRPDVPGPERLRRPRCIFQPGFYNNAKALSDAVNGCATAKFASGKYYFDFRDEERGTGQNALNIATTLIGGEYVGTAIPGACKSPILNDPIPGVQFVFGGTSRITVSDTARVELCGPSNGGEPPDDALPGADRQHERSGASHCTAGPDGRPGHRSQGGRRSPSTAAAPGQAALAAAGGSSIKWVANNNNSEAAVDLSNFSGLDAIPAGSDITSAEVRIKYAKSAAAPSLTVGATGTTPAMTVPAPDATGWASVDLKDQLRTLIGSGTFNATRPKLELRLPGTPKNETLTVDAVTLAVTYVPPSLRAAQDDQIIYAPGGNFHGVFVVQGATFVPKGYVDLDPGSFDTALVAFRWGLVASGVNLKAQPSQTVRLSAGLDARRRSRPGQQGDRRGPQGLRLRRASHLRHRRHARSHGARDDHRPAVHHLGKRARASRAGPPQGRGPQLVGAAMNAIPPAVVAILAGVLGLVIGSFLNVVVHRVPRGESVVSPPSACPRCGTPIRARHNVPVLGWLVLRGRCYDCGSRSAPATRWWRPAPGCSFALAGFRFADRPMLLSAYLAFAAIAVALALIDLDVHRLPNVIVLPSYPVLASAARARRRWGRPAARRQRCGAPVRVLLPRGGGGAGGDRVR